MSTSKLVAVALAATALAASGCGKSSSTGSSTSSTAGSTTAGQTTAAATTPAQPTGGEIHVATGTPLSVTAWISKGDAICGRANVKLSTTTAKNTADFARLLPQSAGYERAEATELSKLVPPSAMAADWQQIVTSLQKFSEFSAKAGEYAAINNLSAAKPVVIAANTSQKEMVAIAKRDGFKVCSLI